MQLIQGDLVNGFSITGLTFQKLVVNRLGAYVLKVGHRELLSGFDFAGCED